MFLAVSPYHLTTREAPAMVALLLAERVVTLMPTPFEGTGHEVLGRAVERVPRYLDFMKSWEWATPLWESGLISSVYDGMDAVDEVREVCRRIQRDPALANLRSVMRPELFEDEDLYLDALARDLLKAGPDPGVSVPVVAGLDRFASRFGLVVVRPDAASVAQRAEMQAARPILSIAVPVLFQAGPEAILETRLALEDTLVPLRDALADLAAEATADDGGAAPDGLIELARQRAAAYSAAFATLAADDGLSCEDDEVRVIHGPAALTLVSLPVDAVLGSSVAAMAVLGGPSRGDIPGEADLAERDPLAGRRVMSLIVRPIGQRPARR